MVGITRLLDLYPPLDIYQMLPKSTDVHLHSPKKRQQQEGNIHLGQHGVPYTIKKNENENHLLEENSSTSSHKFTLSLYLCLYIYKTIPKRIDTVLH